MSSTIPRSAEGFVEMGRLVDHQGTKGTKERQVQGLRMSSSARGPWRADPVRGRLALLRFAVLNLSLRSIWAGFSRGLICLSLVPLVVNEKFRRLLTLPGAWETSGR